MSKKAFTEKRLLKKTQKIHEKRIRAGADDTERSAMVSLLMALENLSGIPMDEPAAQELAGYLLANDQAVTPMASTLEKAHSGVHHISDDQSKT